MTNHTRTDDLVHATFAAGCFWGVEASFREIEGVVRDDRRLHRREHRRPQLRGGLLRTTGHAESVDVVFDPEVVSYDELLDAYWSIHDPTTRDRQGWDFGSQYRPAVFVHDAEQERLAIASRDRRQPRRSAGRSSPTIVPASTFYAGEEYHQRYFEKHGGAACATTIRR